MYCSFLFRADRSRGIRKNDSNALEKYTFLKKEKVRNLKCLAFNKKTSDAQQQMLQPICVHVMEKSGTVSRDTLEAYVISVQKAHMITLRSPSRGGLICPAATKSNLDLQVAGTACPPCSQNSQPPVQRLGEALCV